MEEELVYLEETLTSEEYNAPPATYRDRLLNALLALLIALGISLAGSLMAIGAATVWLYLMVNS